MTPAKVFSFYLCVSVCVLSVLLNCFRGFRIHVYALTENLTLTLPVMCSNFSAVTPRCEGIALQNTSRVLILGLQPRDKAAMLVVNTKEILLLNLHQNRVYFPAERNAFVLDH